MADERDKSDDSTRFAAGGGADDETRFTGVGSPPATGGKSQATFPPGSLLGHTYRIEAFLARGGMGEVYRARHAELNTEHAIKIILPELANNQRIVDLFRREASVLRTIRHDAVVAYDGVSRDENGRLYLVMEFADGPSLSKLMRERPLSADEVRQLRDRLADGLAVAHDKGVIHRDISPDNVILPGGDLGKAKIIDFGISKAVDPEVKTIIGDDFAGKLSYVSPEQLGMFGGQIDGRSDIYSLGLVLAAAAQGEPLDMGLSPIAVIEARRAVPDLARVPAAVRADLAAMLQPDPAKRPQTMREMIRPQEQRGARRPGQPDASRPSSAAKSKSGSMGVIIGALAVLLVAGGGFGYWYWQGRTQRDDATTTAQQSDSGAQQNGGGTTSNTGTAETASTVEQTVQPSTTSTTAAASGDESAATTDSTQLPLQSQQTNDSAAAATATSQTTAAETAVDQPATTTQTADSAATNVIATATDSGTAAGAAVTDTQTALLPHVPDVAKLRSDAERAVQGSSCSGVRLDVSDNGDIRASGYVASPADHDTAAARLAALPDVGRVDNAVVVMARPLCDVLDVLRAHTAFDQGLLALDPGGVAAVYHENDHIQVTVTAPSGFDGYLYVDYVDAAERYVIHLLPNSNFRPDNRVTAGQRIVIGSLSEEYDAYRIQPPFGANLIIAIASRKPLFTDMRKIQEAVDQYLPTLRSSLAQMAAEDGAHLASQYAGVLLKAP